MTALGASARGVKYGRGSNETLLDLICYGRSMTITRRSLFAMLFVAPFAKLFLRRREHVISEGTISIDGAAYGPFTVHGMSEGGRITSVSNVRVNGESIPFEFDGQRVHLKANRQTSSVTVVDDRSAIVSSPARTWNGISRESYLRYQLGQIRTADNARTAREAFERYASALDS